MKKLKTITNRILHISENNKKRTFTIKTSAGKYKTFKMSKEEFENAKYWTGNDWNCFLKTDEYYKI